MTVQTWPGEDQNDPRFGRTYVYGAYWEAGLRIFDVSDVPHPTNTPIEYAFIAGGCAATFGTQLGCNWRAPEVGLWMEFADLDGDGLPDSGTNGNENGGRASYIHYAEPIDEMVDASHIGYPAGKRHLTLLSTEVLETNVGTGMAYLLYTTEYEEVNGQLRFLRSSYTDTRFAEEHLHPGAKNGSYSARTTPIPRYSKLRDRTGTPVSAVPGMVGYTCQATTRGYGSWT